MAKVLLVEPYLVGSHQAWVTGWIEHSRHDVAVLGHTGEHWRWRMRGGAVSLARLTREHLGRSGSVDVVLGSNMLDLAGFLGLARPQLGAARVVQYFHENQLTYPRQSGEALDSGLAWMQWRGAVAADELWFNSAFHRNAFVAAVDELLAAAPDEPHQPERDVLEERIWVAPPGIAYEECRRGVTVANERPLIVSNQRWHHDKDVGSVVRAVRRLVRSGVECDLAVVGDETGGEAEQIAPLLDELGDRVVARGHVSRSDYLALLRRADVVVSAARGENFGIAVAEAIAAGAWPVLPRALAYPELIPEAHHPNCLYDEGELGRCLTSAVAAVAAGHSAPAGLAFAMWDYAWPTVAARLDDRIDSLCAV